MRQLDQGVQDANVLLVRCVKKFPSLYDIGSPDYSLKQHTKRSWDAVAEQTGLTAAECRSRWRNLRISYLRYLRQTRTPSKKLTKPYYLLEEMGFMEGFVRHGDNSNMSKISFKVEEGEDPQQIFLTIHKGEEEELDEEQEEETMEEDPADALVQVPAAADEQQQQPQQRQGNTNPDQPGSSTAHTEQLLTELAHPDLAFFRSILPDVESMSAAQKAKFKYSVMASLNSILYP